MTDMHLAEPNYVIRDINVSDMHLAEPNYVIRDSKCVRYVPC
jgi:hypothetical protein